MLSRRQFLTSTAGLLGASMLRPRFSLAQSAGAGSGKNVIVFNLYGGCDGLSAFPYYSGPIADLMTTKYRPTLSSNRAAVIPFLPQNGDADKIGFHPAIKPLVDVAAARLAIIRGYGILGDPGRSHDTCQTLMSLGVSSIGAQDNVGFLARIMDSRDWESFQYWALVTQNPSDINTRKRPPIVVSDLSRLTFPRSWWEQNGDASLAQEISDTIVEVQIPNDALGVEQQTSQHSLSNVLAVVRSDIIGQQVGNNSAGDYSSTGIGIPLRDAARVLKAKYAGGTFDFAAKDSIFLLGQDGYDTHSNQITQSDAEGLSGLLGSLASNLAVFYRDLELMGAIDNTVIVIYSEFGRTVRENGARGALTVGTDHGHGNSTIVLGGPTKQGIYGGAPELGQLADEYYDAIVPSTDYRDIFSEVLWWLGIEPKTIFSEASYAPKRIGVF